MDRSPQTPENERYRTAARLAETVSKKLGLKYAEVVRSCVYCHFGEEFDLATATLQEAFYRDVVFELDRVAEFMT
jgi:hypothetical protein